MAKTAVINIRVDPTTKAGAEELFSQFGITVTDAVNLFLHQSLIVGGIPFEIKQLRYNAETEAAMQEARDIMSGKLVRKTYQSVAEMNADIGSDIN